MVTFVAAVEISKEFPRFMGTIFNCGPAGVLAIGVMDKPACQRCPDNNGLGMGKS